MTSTTVQILMVGDASGTRRRVCELLEREGTIRVIWVSSIAEARLRIAMIHPDAILLDLLLKDDAEREEVRALRELAPGTAVIAVTNRGNRAAAVGNLKDLFDDYVVPAYVDSKSLARSIFRQLSGRQTGGE